MATKKIKVSVGDGLPDEKTVGEFYVDVVTDIMYFKNEEGGWEVKPINPTIKNPQYR